MFHVPCIRIPVTLLLLSNNIITPITQPITLAIVNRPQLQVPQLATGFRGGARASSRLELKVLFWIYCGELGGCLGGRLDEGIGGVRSAGDGGQGQELE